MAGQDTKTDPWDRVGWLRCHSFWVRGPYFQPPTHLYLVFGILPWPCPPAFSFEALLSPVK